jgi:hypothetical protein
VVNKRFLGRGGVRAVLVALAGLTTVVFVGAGVSGAASYLHRVSSNNHHGSKRVHGHPKLGDYTVSLHMDWVVHYPDLPIGTEVTVTYVTTPGGCTTDEHGAKYTLTQYQYPGYDITPLFNAKSSGSCGFYASYADYDVATKFPDGGTGNNRIRVEEDGTSGKYSVTCGKGLLGCYPSFKQDHNATVTFRF